MLKSLLRDKLLLFLVALAVIIKIWSLNESWVERYYTYGVYPYISKGLRLALGWCPFSIGDLLYFAAFVYLVVKAWKFLNILKRRQVKEFLFHVLIRRLLHVVLYIYLAFNILWGLNYNRQGISEQLNLNVQPYTIQELNKLTSEIINRLNVYAEKVDTINRHELDKNAILFKEAVATFKETGKNASYLKYDIPSLKPSMYTHVGHFFGFSGYYNPFSGEAQIKTTIPTFLKPFVITHEIGHQLGYGKENEANFVAYFVSRNSKNIEFRYSVYYEMYLYSYRELYKRDSTIAIAYKEVLHPQVKSDNNELREYFLRTSNPVEPLISAFYDEYLRMNSQPQGKMTYNQVVAWLIAYAKKYGYDAI